MPSSACKKKADREVDGAGVVGLDIVELFARFFFFCKRRPRPMAALFPYTTLFRSEVVDRARVDREGVGRAGRARADGVVDGERVRLGDGERDSGEIGRAHV